MCEEGLKWSGNAAEIECLDEKWRVPDLPGAAAEEAAKLRLFGTPLPLLLLLERTEGRELPASVEDGLDAGCPERPDQLALEVRLADVEAETLELFPRARGPETDPLQRPPEGNHLACVAETSRAYGSREVAEKPADRMRTTDRHDLDTLVGEVPLELSCQGLHGGLVARALDEDDPAGGRRDIHSDRCVLPSPRGLRASKESALAHPSGDKGIETKEEARRYHRDGIERHFSQHLTDADVKALTRALEKVSAHARPFRHGRIRGSHDACA